MFVILLHLDGSQHFSFFIYVIVEDVMSIPHTYVLHMCIRSEACENTVIVWVCELCATEQSICSTGFQPPAAAALSGRVISFPSAVFMATKKQARIQVCTWLSLLSRFIESGEESTRPDTQQNVSSICVGIAWRYN